MTEPAPDDRSAWLLLLGDWLQSKPAAPSSGVWGPFCAFLAFVGIQADAHGFNRRVPAARWLGAASGSSNNGQSVRRYYEAAEAAGVLRPHYSASGRFVQGYTLLFPERPDWKTALERLTDHAAAYSPTRSITRPRSPVPIDHAATYSVSTQVARDHVAGGIAERIGTSPERSRGHVVSDHVATGSPYSLVGQQRKGSGGEAFPPAADAPSARGPARPPDPQRLPPPESPLRSVSGVAPGMTASQLPAVPRDQLDDQPQPQTARARASGLVSYAAAIEERDAAGMALAEHREHCEDYVSGEACAHCSRLYHAWKRWSREVEAAALRGAAHRGPRT